ncbi:MAG: phosphatidate cytidylyltransferase [Betaproteobacteria bacterium]
MLATRVLTALVLASLVLAALFLLPPRGWGLAVLTAIVAASAEWASLAGYTRWPWRLFVAGTIAIGAALLFSPIAGFDRGWPDIVVVTICGAATLFWILVVPFWLGSRWRPSSRLVMAGAGWLVLIGAWVALVALQARSPWIVLAAMAIVWVADTAAYFAGRAFGRRKLAPAISPGKTWEGVYGALAAVAVYALALVPLATAAGYRGPVSAPVVAAWVALALVLAALSVAGDLFESLLKRHAGVKDSGKLLPGHGGVLDRTDALLAAMPPAALAAWAFLR